MKRKKKKHQRLYIKVKQNKPREHIQRKIKKKKKTFRKRESPVINRGERREGGDRQKMEFKEI
jgi:hypothetical protein